MNCITITAHSLVKNESRWIWYSLLSVLDSVDEIMVWDTGSVDKTIDIINTLASPKIKLQQVSVTDAENHSALREKMLQETKSDWFLILDGDEVWWWDNIRVVIDAINNHPGVAGIISPFVNAVGDLYHFQDPSRVNYHIHNFRGPYTIRAINRAQPDLHLVHPHGRQEFQTEGVALQNLPEDRLVYVDRPFLHLSHLPRSDTKIADKNTLKRAFKYRYELGHNFRPDFVLPEVFYLPKPPVVPDSFFHRTPAFIARATVTDILRSGKRLLPFSTPSGY